MNNLTLFKNEKLGEVRTAIEEDKIFFNLSDVCEILGIEKSRNVKNRLSEKGVCSKGTPTNGGIQPMLYVDESNLYKVIFQSRKPEAEQFTEWVTGEILPSIRKNGMYATENTIDQILNDPDFEIKLLTNLKEEKEKTKHLMVANQIKDQQIAEFQPVKDYVDRILSDTDSMITITQIAADYGLTAQGLNTILNEQRVIRKVNDQWVLYADHLNKGYTKSETIEVARKDGTMKTVINTKWLQKGRLKIHEILTNLGISADLNGGI